MKLLAAKKVQDKISQLAGISQAEFQRAVNNIDELAKSNLSKLIASSQKMAGQVYVFRSGTLRIFYTFDKSAQGELAIVLLDVIMGMPVNRALSVRNPSINSSLNPMVNTSRNPRVNSSLNPLVNSSLNPRVNSSRNPRVNSSINPRVNSSLNPNINSSLNPRVNSSLNPQVNSAINPDINPLFEGFYVYDLSLKPVNFVIPASDEAFLVFQPNRLPHSIWLSNGADGFNAFSIDDLEWCGIVLPDGADGFNCFDTNCEWLGFVR